MKKLFAVCASLALVASLGGCSDPKPVAEDTTQAVTQSTTQSTTQSAPQTIGNATVQLTLADGTITAEGSGVSVDGTVATISQGGTYVVSGEMADGRIVVNSASSDTVTLCLNQVSLSNSTGPVIDVQLANNVVLQLADGTVNTISDASNYIFEGALDEPDAAIYSKEDMVIRGGGELVLSGNYKSGIVSKDTLLIEDGTLNIKAQKHGIVGKDYVIVNGGSIVVEASGDAIKATNDVEVAMGYVEINGGTLDLTAADDGIYAISRVTINGGDTKIETANNAIKSEQLIDLQSGSLTILTDDDDFVCQTREGSGNTALTVNHKSVTFP